MAFNVNCVLQIVFALLFAPCALAVNPAQWTIVEQVTRAETMKTWTSPTAIDLDKMVWQYDFEITKLTATVNLGIFGNVTEDITDSIPPEDRMSSGETTDLPAVLLDDMIVEPESGTSADIFVEIDSLGFGRALFSNIMLGSVEVPLFGTRPIERINLEASVNVIGYDFGDYNRNGAVDAADYTVWRDTFGSTSDLAADGDQDGMIDGDDYTVWKTNFAAQAGASATSAAAAVPEPQTWCVLLTTAILAARTSRPLRGRRAL